MVQIILDYPYKKFQAIAQLEMMPKRLNEKLNQVIIADQKNFMQQIKRRAKGNIKRFITMDIKKNKVTVKSTSRAGFFQEMGFRPHVIPIEYAEYAHKNPNFNGKGVPKGVYAMNKKGIAKPKGYIKVAKNTPFISPVIGSYMQTIQKNMNKGVTDIVKSIKI